MRLVGFCWHRLALRFVIPAIFAVWSQTSAQGQWKTEVVPKVPHSQLVYSVAFSTDGTRLLSGSEDKTLKLWDTTTGQLIRTFEGHSSGVRSVAFLPDGTHLVSAGSWD